MNPMNNKSVEEKSLEAADKFLSSVSQEEYQKIIEDVESMEFNSPTIQEYFGNFESEFHSLFTNDFEETIQLHRMEKREFTTADVFDQNRMDVNIIFEPPGNLMPNYKKQALEYSGVFCLDLHYA